MAGTRDVKNESKINKKKMCFDEKACANPIDVLVLRA